MTVRQKFTLLLFIFGFGLSASPLLLMLGAHDLTSAFDCLVIDVMAEACVKYGNSFVRVLYATFVAAGQQYVLVTVPMGVVLVASGIVMTFIDESRNTKRV